jgi:competence protein ComEA
MDKIIEWTKKSKVLLALNLAILMVVFTGFWFLSKSTESAVEAPKDIFLTQELLPQEPLEEVEKNETIFVDIKGEVASPGIYEVNENMRVNDAIQQAGGFLETADTKQVNLSRRLQDQMVIYVAKLGEETFEITQEIMDTTPSQSSGKVNINTADVSELQTLNGVGQKRAEEIIQYRQINGSFKSVEDLTNVSGFGAKTLERLREFITVK